MNKTLKVIYNFQPMNAFYPHATWGKVFKWKLARTIRNISILALFVATGYVSARVYNAIHPVTVFADKEVDVSSARFDAKIEALKDKVVDEVFACESQGYKPTDGLITFDPKKDGTTPASNTASIGPGQFKKGTIITYYKKLYSKDVTGTDAIIIALDLGKAKSLAKDVMFKTAGKASGDWYNCAVKNNSDAKIDLIKAMEK